VVIESVEKYGYRISILGDDGGKSFTDCRVPKSPNRVTVHVGRLLQESGVQRQERAQDVAFRCAKPSDGLGKRGCELNWRSQFVTGQVDARERPT
jgi:hypothetical protein